MFLSDVEIQKFKRIFQSIHPEAPILGPPKENGQFFLQLIICNA
jgi:hypothetical protein